MYHCVANAPLQYQCDTNVPWWYVWWTTSKYHTGTSVSILPHKYQWHIGATCKYHDGTFVSQCTSFLCNKYATQMTAYCQECTKELVVIVIWRSIGLGKCASAFHRNNACGLLCGELVFISTLAQLVNDKLHLSPSQWKIEAVVGDLNIISI